MKLKKNDMKRIKITEEQFHDHSRHEAVKVEDGEVRQKIHKMLSSIGLRLQGTHYQPLYERMRDSIIALNNNLINDIRGNNKQ